MAIATPSKIEMWPVARLVPYENNARTHSPEQVEKVAASIVSYGFNVPILVDTKDGIIAGHCRLMAAKELQLEEVPVIKLDHLTEKKKRAYILADNRLTELGGWDEELLADELLVLKEDGEDLDAIGWTDEEMEEMMESIEMLDTVDPEVEVDAVPEVPVDPVSKPGDVWKLGRHRVMCGDSTNVQHVEKLMAGKKAALLHADPPYGMGKESDGVANDNLYQEKLDQFQMEWWATFRTFIDDNASAYIWGNAPDLWRLWWKGGLGDSEKMEMRNQIVWDKKTIPGMKSDLMTQYPMATEHCLFFQIGEQFIGNINSVDFPEQWEPLRSYLESQAKAASIGPSDIKRICECQMYSHWFTKSQFTLISKKHYELLGKTFPGLFQRPWESLKKEWDQVRGTGRDIINDKLGITRSYFNNAHDIMRDVWEFGRVQGEERHGHATPKPVDMMQRIMFSSLPQKGLCVEPFGGSGSTLIAAHLSKRVCYSMELQPEYVDVIVKRWENLTGLKAELEN